MTANGGEFSAAFRRHVVPKLAAHARISGLRISYGRGLFSEETDRLMRIAISLGAMHLPRRIYADLEDWIATELLEMTTAWEAVEKWRNRDGEKLLPTGG